MKFKEAIRKCEWFIIPAVLIIAAFFGGSYYGEQKAYANIEVARDTVIKVVTVYRDFPEPAKAAQIGYVSVPCYKFITDTVTNETIAFLHDTTVVYLPREQKYYEEDEGRLRLWVSGYDPMLDRYELDRIETTVTNTVVPKRKHWGLTVSGGYGVALADKRVILSPFIGIGASYIIASW